MITKKILIGLLLIPLFGYSNNPEKIDRYSLVNRHNIHNTEPGIESVLSVGNGNIAFNMDITGLQTFQPDYTKYPLITLSQWGWHSFPNLNGYTLEDVYEEMEIRGKKHLYPSIGYSLENPGEGLDNPAYQYLRKNPHKFNLGCIGFDYKMKDGSEMQLSNIKNPSQKLDLWNGMVYSNFTIDNQEVKVKTLCHPREDIIAVKIDSKLLTHNNLGIKVRFPYIKLGEPNPSDWKSTNKHETVFTPSGKSSAKFIRVIDSTRYQVNISSSDKFIIKKIKEHEYRISFPGKISSAELLFSFSPEPMNITGDYKLVKDLSIEHWNAYWTTGGAIDFSGSLDPRAKELERRIVLSQYLTAIHCSGSLPPQESGLVHNSWHGKFHLEMHFWHAAHFALWGHPEKLEKSMDWYLNFLDEAKKLAASYGDGNEGARWPKMVGPTGRETPNKINPFILWQQPHVIYMCELLYRANPTDSILNKYKSLVIETADFLADFPYWDEQERRYFIGPPVQPMEELHSPELNYNPTCELSYWNFGLKTAIKWRERLGMEPVKKWDHVINHLSPLPMAEACNNKKAYVSSESEKGIWSNCEMRLQHPSMLWAKGVIPGDMVDDAIMDNTLYCTKTTFNFDAIWGWDPPMMAMTATRLNNPEWATDFLFVTSKNNRFNKVGHCTQWNQIYAYLPANGGILLATALMTAGWDDNETENPGFPKNGLWNVKMENILPLP